MFRTAQCPSIGTDVSQIVENAIEDNQDSKKEQGHPKRQRNGLEIMTIHRATYFLRATKTGEAMQSGTCSSFSGLEASDNLPVLTIGSCAYPCQVFPDAPRSTLLHRWCCLG